jgi:DNA adenine methylase
MNEDTLKFLDELQNTSHSITEYVSWDKLFKNNTIEIEKFETLARLLGKNTAALKNEIDLIFQENKQFAFAMLPLFLGSRPDKNKQFCYFDATEIEVVFDYTNPEIVKNFIMQSGLHNQVFKEASKNELKYLLYGIEIGLGSNDKKNKTGKYMENLISKILTEYKINFLQQARYSNYISLEKDQDDKVFDFVFSVNNMTYCVETNFFNAGGSKLNSETARFVALNETFSKFDNLKFVWITDGRGLKTISKQVNNALQKIEFMFNIKRFTNWISKLEKSEYVK